MLHHPKALQLVDLRINNPNRHQEENPGERELPLERVLQSAFHERLAKSLRGIRRNPEWIVQIFQRYFCRQVLLLILLALTVRLYKPDMAFRAYRPHIYLAKNHYRFQSDAAR